MPNPVQEVPVLLTDLEVILATVNSAYNANMAHDLSEQYRKLQNRNQWSAMTKALEGSLAKLEAYVKSAEEQDD